VQPRDSDLIRDRFGVTDEGIYVERNGRPVRGSRPEWLDWPSHTAADMVLIADMARVKR
jgi:hypothetical protein